MKFNLIENGEWRIENNYAECKSGAPKNVSFVGL